MPPDPFFIFYGKVGDLVKIHYADRVYEDLGILVERCGDSHPDKWLVLVDGSIHRLYQGRLEVISEKTLDSSDKD
tara:strand:+ start:1656 stop:1880 length:225 start_codon:yes stop_codon:yes gene_type:complete